MFNVHPGFPYGKSRIDLGVGALPQTLRSMGHEVIVVMPRYGSIDAGFRDPAGNGWKMIQAPQAAA